MKTITAITVAALLAALLTFAGPAPAAGAHNSKCVLQPGTHVGYGLYGGVGVQFRNTHSQWGKICYVGITTTCRTTWGGAAITQSKSVALPSISGSFPAYVTFSAGCSNNGFPYFFGEWSYWAYHPHGCQLC